jgi:hypothetical protein
MFTREKLQPNEFKEQSLGDINKYVLSKLPLERQQHAQFFEYMRTVDEEKKDPPSEEERKILSDITNKK